MVLYHEATPYTYRELGERLYNVSVGSVIDVERDERGQALPSFSPRCINKICKIAKKDVDNGGTTLTSVTKTRH